MNDQAKPKKLPGNFIENRVSWTPELLAALGTAIDLDIAKRFGTSKSTITKKRMALGIPPYDDPESTRTRGLYTPEVLASLGTGTDRAIAKRLGVSKEAVKKKRQRSAIPHYPDAAPENLDHLFTPDVIALLGVESDVKIGQMLECDSESVRARRIALGIAPVVVMTKLPEEAYGLLGTMPDTEIAKKYGVGIYAIRGARKKRGVPAFDSGIGKLKAKS